MRDKEWQRVSLADETFDPPKEAKKPAADPVGYIAIGFGISATFVWSFFATLNSVGKPGAVVELHVAAFAGLIGTAIGTFIGLFIERFRR
jgi:hypothetical protein